VFIPIPVPVFVIPIPIDKGGGGGGLVPNLLLAIPSCSTVNGSVQSFLALPEPTLSTSSGRVSYPHIPRSAGEAEPSLESISSLFIPRTGILSLESAGFEDPSFIAGRGKRGG
jgi:hypothetical protein